MKIYYRINSPEIGEVLIKKRYLKNFAGGCEKTDTSTLPPSIYIRTVGVWVALLN